MADRTGGRRRQTELLVHSYDESAAGAGHGVHMQRTLFEEDHDEFRKSVQTFVARTIVPDRDSMMAQRSIDRSVWLEAGRQGFLGLDVPEKYGGNDAGDFRFNAVFAEELAKVSVGLASCLTIHTDVVAPYLLDLGTDAQKERWLPGFCTGELVTAIAMTEPSGGSDLGALRTSAVRDGSEWVINGSKTFITNAMSADLVVVAARTSPGKGAKGISLFGVEHDRDGFARGTKLDKVGQPEADTGELFFTDVRVPEDNLIGEVDRGFIAMMERLPRERTSSAITNVANATQILSETIDYAKAALGLRPADRLVPVQQVHPGRAGHKGRGHAGLRRPVHRRPLPPGPSPRSTPPRPSGGRPRCRTPCSMPACSSTAATATCVSTGWPRRGWTGASPKSGRAPTRS